MPGVTYPPVAPVVDGQGRITVEQYLRNPTRITRDLVDLTRERFLAERIFTVGGAEGGAVIYDQANAQDLYMGRDVQAIEPGSEFPILVGSDSAPKVAAVTKWGGAAALTYEAVRRDSRDVLGRELRRLRNTIVRKVDTVAIAALNAAPILGAAGSDWDSPTTGDVIGDLAVARSAIDDQDLGYEATDVLINPAQYVALMRNEKVRNALPRETAATNPISSGELNGLMGFTWYVTNRVAPGSAFVLAGRQAGSLRDELGLYTRVIDQPERERWLVQAARVTVPVVTDPRSVYKLSGL